VAFGGLHAKSFSRPSVHANCAWPKGVAKLALNAGGGAWLLRAPQSKHAAPLHSGGPVIQSKSERWPMGTERLVTEPDKKGSRDSPAQSAEYEKKRTP
jgi:hypothetical protein